MKAFAVFYDWQEVPGSEPIALYNIIGRRYAHHHSTVTAKFLVDHGIPVPPHPTYEESKQRQSIGEMIAGVWNVEYAERHGWLAA